MKVKELMIGDWMYNCIANIRFQIYPQFFSQWYNRTEQFMATIQPISLTPEILEKNGWEYNDEDAKFFPKTWVGGGLKLHGTDDGGYRIVVTSDYDDEDTNDTPFIILYVHELQHALRLCRIEKEIIL